ncbi:MAG: hypothetical protein IPM82_08195 [Saprospiraceae bacterium]|nr:hypothetical protein [Saprospiraceae bacterium]
MVWLILLGVLLILVTVLLVLPVSIEIDTAKQVFQARWQGILRIRAVPESHKWRWFYRVFLVEKEWAPTPQKPKAPKQKKAAQKKPSFTPRQIWSMLKNMFRAVDVRRFRVDWDTDDFASMPGCIRYSSC